MPQFTLIANDRRLLSTGATWTNPTLAYDRDTNTYSVATSATTRTLQFVSLFANESDAEFNRIPPEAVITDITMEYLASQQAGGVCRMNLMQLERGSTPHGSNISDAYEPAATPTPVEYSGVWGLTSPTIGDFQNGTGTLGVRVRFDHISGTYEVRLYEAARITFTYELPDDGGGVSYDETTGPLTDTYLDELTPTTNYKTDFNVEYGEDGSGNINRGLLFCPLEMPAAATVTQATLNMLRSLADPGAPFDAWIRRCTEPFADHNATWNTYDGGNAWSSAGGDISSTNEIAFVNDGTTDSVDCAALFNDALAAGHSQIGLFIMADLETTDNMHFLSVDFTIIPAQRPSLDVAWCIFPDPPINVSPADAATDVDPTDVDLVFEGGNFTEAFDVYFSDTESDVTTKDAGALIAADVDGIYDPEQLERTVNAGELLENTTYYWRVIAKNNECETDGEVWSFDTGEFPPEPEPESSGDCQRNRFTNKRRPTNLLCRD